MAKKKSAMERLADKVDHVLHPDKPVAEEAVVVEASEPARAVELPASKYLGDYSKHPKFSKFKQGDN